MFRRHCVGRVFNRLTFTRLGFLLHGTTLTVPKKQTPSSLKSSMNEVLGAIFSAGRKFSRPALFGLDPPQKSLSCFNEERHDTNDRSSTAALISFSL